MEPIYRIYDCFLFDMLFESKRRYSPFTVALLVSLLLLTGTACVIDEMPVPANPPAVNPGVTGNTTAPATLDIKSFTAHSKTIKLGEDTVLAWKVAGASSLSIDPSVGSVTGNSGSVVISPRETTLYTLKASDELHEISTKFLVIVKTLDGTIIWPNSGSDNGTAETLYEGWSSYPNKYVEWQITDTYKDRYPDTDNCWHVGYITNNHSNWMMTQVTINNKIVLDSILPSTRTGYTVSIDCLQPPEMKWKWKAYK